MSTNGAFVARRRRLSNSVVSGLWQMAAVAGVALIRANAAAGALEGVLSVQEWTAIFWARGAGEFGHLRRT
jgi:hypothetical protein